MSVPSNEQVINRYLDAHLRHDNEEIGRLRAPGWFSEWPQSKERVRGHANDMQIMANWPGGSPEAAGIPWAMSRIRRGRSSISSRAI